MKKFLVFLALLLIAILVAGIYGILHDQITYSISAEYYTKFKFRQFGLLHSDLPDRVKAAIVGFGASWWMGIPIGLLVGLVGLIHREPRRIFRITVRSFLIVAGFTLLFALAGLGYGYYRTSAINLRDYDYWFIPENVDDLRSFLCVGYMHNSSYLGGAASIIVAWIFHVRVRMRQGSLPRKESDSPISPDIHALPSWLFLTLPTLAAGSYLTSYFVIVDLHHPARLSLPVEQSRHSACIRRDWPRMGRLTRLSRAAKLALPADLRA